MSDLFKRSESSGEWTFVAGSTEPNAAPTLEQGMGVPIFGNLSGPGARTQPAWFARTHRHTRSAASSCKMEVRRAG